MLTVTEKIYREIIFTKTKHEGAEQFKWTNSVLLLILIADMN